MKVQELLKYLREDGWEIDRTRGSHRQLVHTSKPGTVTVSGHPGDDIHPKTLKSVLRQSRPRGSIMKEYTVIYEAGTRNWSAYVPDLPGCIATGKTRSMVEQQIREAIEFHIEGLKARGEEVPEPSIEAGCVSVSVD